MIPHENYNLTNRIFKISSFGVQSVESALRTSKVLPPKSQRVVLSCSWVAVCLCALIAAHVFFCIGDTFYPKHSLILFSLVLFCINDFIELFWVRQLEPPALNKNGHNPQVQRRVCGWFFFFIFKNKSQSGWQEWNALREEALIVDGHGDFECW